MSRFEELIASKTKSLNGPWIEPSLLSANFLNLDSELDSIQNAGADIIHLDIMDGHFVPNISFGPPIVKAVCQKTTMPKIAHLMIYDPLKYSQIFADMGVEAISFHIEATDKPFEILNKIKKMGSGLVAGIAIKPSTPLKDAELLVQECDFILIMSVEPGFSGQSFMEIALNKIEKLANIRHKMGKNMPIEVDGGINANTARLCRNAGADLLVSGNYIFKANNMKIAIDSLR